MAGDVVEREGGMMTAPNKDLRLSNQGMIQAHPDKDFSFSTDAGLMSVSDKEFRLSNEGLMVEDAKRFRLEDFSLLTTIGTGTFARVCLCQEEHTRDYYALKVLIRGWVELIMIYYSKLAIG